ncbi:MAG: hypothetical protein M1617_00700 [Actinobacteria bacterium]|nr:hypothetical protein [Actinomycetota bacterium]
MRFRALTITLLVNSLVLGVAGVLADSRAVYISLRDWEGILFVLNPAVFVGMFCGWILRKEEEPRTRDIYVMLFSFIWTAAAIARVFAPLAVSGRSGFFDSGLMLLFVVVGIGLVSVLPSRKAKGREHLPVRAVGGS